MQGHWRAMLTCFERGWPATVAKDGPKGQGCKGTFGKVALDVTRNLPMHVAFATPLSTTTHGAPYAFCLESALALSTCGPYLW
eukprot:1553938-Pyramimonas_sp.AAC.1